MAKKRSKRSGGIAWFHYVKKDYSLENTALRQNLARGLAQGEKLENGNRWAVRLYHEAISDDLGPLASWDTSEALCKKIDMKHFFADGSRALAKKVCERCPIKEECLDIAIKCNISHGIWGSMTPHERGHRRSGQSRYDEIIFIVETKHKEDQENTNYLDVKWHVTP